MASPRKECASPSIMNNNINNELEKEKQKQKEEEREKRFKEFWGTVIPTNLSEIPIGEEVLRYPMMEVLEVHIISNSNHRKKLNINGTITVDANYGISTIFSRSYRNPKVIHSQDALTLTGPDIGTIATDFFNIIVDIKDDRQQVCKGGVYWDLHNDNYYLHNQWLICVVTGNICRARVTYAIFTSAILIDVQIKLPEMDNYPSEMRNKKQQEFKIYGTIIASITTRDKKIKKIRRKDAFITTEEEQEEEEEDDDDDDEGEEGSQGEEYAYEYKEEWVIRDVLTTTLFRRKHTNNANILAKEGGVLPLSKFLIAFPQDADFQINLNLKEHSPIKSCDSTIANTIVTCTPTHFGDRKYSIESKYGFIELKLCAYPLNMHPKSYAGLKKIFYPRFQ